MLASRNLQVPLGGGRAIPLVSSRGGGMSCRRDHSARVSCRVTSARTPRASRSPPGGRPPVHATGGRSAETAGDTRRAADRLCRQRHLSGVPRRQGELAQGHAARQREEPALAGSDARLRELPRPRAGARRRRREGAHQEVRADEARRDQRDLPDVPQPRRACGLGRQRARSPQPLLLDLPQRAQSEVAPNSSSSRRPRRRSARRATGCR